MEEASAVKKRIEIGPWGVHGGSECRDDGSSIDGIREISLVYGRCIDSIKVVYNKNGRPFTAQKKHGGNGGDKTGEAPSYTAENYEISDHLKVILNQVESKKWSEIATKIFPDTKSSLNMTFDLIYDHFQVVRNSIIFSSVSGQFSSISFQVKLQFPEEYLTSISGYYGPERGSLVIRSLTFKSNLQRTFGPFGLEEGTPFSVPVEGGKIGGLKGRNGWYIDSIGCYIACIQTPNAAAAAANQKGKKTRKKRTTTVVGHQNKSCSTIT